MNMRNLVMRGVAVVAAGVMVGSAAGTAHADTTPRPTLRHDIAKSADGYCVVDLDVGAKRCATTEAGAKAMVRGKRTVMTAWGKPGWKGKHVNFYVRLGRPCDGPQIFAKVNDLRKIRSGLPGKQNWNNRMSSLVMRKGCKVQLHAKADFEGSHTDWLGTRARLGKVPDPGRNWNNAATSLLFAGS